MHAALLQMFVVIHKTLVVLTHGDYDR